MIGPSQLLATVRTFGQHRLELAELAVRRIDNHSEWVIASRRVFGRNIALKQFHARRNLSWRAILCRSSRCGADFHQTTELHRASAHFDN